ncbi:MAG: hypothetical protein DMF84_22155 [Acidobacteria bacterium]|nr:MAG: hypothetical protein DMF84_22155 [Acidobacteriota bacterium]
MTHDGRLVLLELAPHVLPFWSAVGSGRRHVDVAIAEALPAGDLALFHFPPHCVVRALACFLALEFVGERGE